MLDTIQVKINDLVDSIERLEPLAEAERLAQVAGIENFWHGATEELAAAREKRDELMDERRAQLLAEEVRQLQAEQERRLEPAAQLKEIDARIADFPPEIHDYFARADNLGHWTAITLGRVPYASRGLLTFSGEADAFGNLRDVSPKDQYGQPVVPDDKWSAVQELRSLHIERVGIGRQLDLISKGIQGMIARNPALAHVKPRQKVSA